MENIILIANCFCRPLLLYLVGDQEWYMASRPAASTSSCWATDRLASPLLDAVPGGTGGAAAGTACGGRGSFDLP